MQLSWNLHTFFIFCKINPLTTCLIMTGFHKCRMRLRIVVLTFPGSSQNNIKLRNKEVKSRQKFQWKLTEYMKDHIFEILWVANEESEQNVGDTQSMWRAVSLKLRESKMHIGYTVTVILFLGIHVLSEPPAAFDKHLTSTLKCFAVGMSSQISSCNNYWVFVENFQL